MRKCPYCEGEIQDEVFKCKHCGEWVSEKAKLKHSSGFWEDLGQRAKKGLDKFNANAENREEQQQKDEKSGCLSCLGCLGIIIIMAIIGVGIYFVAK